MPRVEADAEVTLVVLVYRSLKWLDWCIAGADRAINETKFRWLIVANDATQEVRDGLDSRVSDWIDFRSSDPSAPYIGRVYAAWNEGVLCARTPLVILANSDMLMSDYAIDELVETRRRVPKSVPCGLLVEHGRIPSGMPEYVRQFGTTPETFQSDAFQEYAASIRRRGKTEPGRLYQPALFDRQEFSDLSGYPLGNPGGVSGDRVLFRRYQDAGFTWLTCLGSVTYHCQEGEMRDV